jgi:protein-tyrosine phosphatase
VNALPERVRGTAKGASAAALARSVLAAARHLPDRLLHGARRERARERVALSRPIRSALFICHGNICRSPFAAVLFSREMTSLGARVDVSSAGFIGPGRTPPPRALSAAARLGVDMSAHRSTLITPEALGAADLIVVMSAEQAAAVKRARRGRGVHGTVVVLGDLDPEPIARRTIRDPWDGDDAVFDESYARIVRCLDELTRAVAGPTAP